MPYKPKITTRGISTTTVTADAIPKGSPMTNDELDSNFLNLRDQSFALVGDDSTGIDIRSGDTIKLTGAGGATVTAAGDTITITAGGGGGGGSLGDLSVIGSTILAPSNGDLGLQTSGNGYVHVKDKLAVAKEIYFDDYGADEVEPPGNGARMRILDEEIDINSGRASIDSFRIYSRAGTGSQEFILDVRSTGDASDFGHLKIYGLSYPQSDGTAGQAITTDGAGQLNFTTIGTAVGATGPVGATGATGATGPSGSVSLGDYTFTGNKISTTSSNANLEIDAAGTGIVHVLSETLKIGTAKQTQGYISSVLNMSGKGFITTNSNYQSNNGQISNVPALYEPFILLSESDTGSGGGGGGNIKINTGYDVNTSNGGSLLLEIENGGYLKIETNKTGTTIGANGAASALTANPVGYLKIFINGSEKQIPYYNV